MTDAITEWGPGRQFCVKREKVMENWRKLHIQEFCGSDQSPNMIMIIKSRRLRKAGNDEHMMEEQNKVNKFF
jgi:hypothetical protein